MASPTLYSTHSWPVRAKAVPQAVSIPVDLTSTCLPAVARVAKRTLPDTTCPTYSTVKERDHGPTTEYARIDRHASVEKGAARFYARGRCLASPPAR